MAPKISFRAYPGPDIIDESALFTSPAGICLQTLWLKIKIGRGEYNKFELFTLANTKCQMLYK